MPDLSKQSGHTAQSLPHPCLIRVDASETIGTGHVMRCLALASVLREHCPQVVFLLGQCPGPLINRLRGENFTLQFLPAEIIEGSVEDANHTVDLALKLAHSDSEDKALPWVIVDGYHFLADYQRLLQGTEDKRLNLLYIDDLNHCEEYTADLILNQNPSALAAQYPALAKQSELLLGLPWTLLRDEFLRYKSDYANGTSLNSLPEKVEEILVTMGGADIDNVTASVMRALAILMTKRNAEDAAVINVMVLIGGGNQHGEAVQQLAEQLNVESGAERFLCMTNASNMPTLIGESDLIISAGGTTVWEAAFLQRPTAVLITADNQIAGMTAFAQSGAIVILETDKDLAEQITVLLDDYKKRQLMVASASIIDGQGAANLVQAMIRKTYN